MATTHAVRQFEYGWELYQRGERGDQLWSNIANFAKARGLSDSYRFPLHCLKTVAGSTATEPQAGLRAFVLSCELARRYKGLNHHVVALCATRAGLLRTRCDAVTQAMVNRAKQLLCEGKVGSPSKEASEMAASVPPTSTPLTAPEPEHTDMLVSHRESADVDLYRLGRSWLIRKAR